MSKNGAQDVKIGAIMVGGIAGLLALAALAAWGLIAMLKRLPQRGVTWRFGLANLRRRPLASSLQIGALALGLMALLLLTVVRGDLMRNWRASLPPDAPNHFVVNVLPDQVEGVRAALKAAQEPTRASIDGARPSRRGQRHAARYRAIRGPARAAPCRARVRSVLGADLPGRIASPQASGSTAPRRRCGISMEQGIADSLKLSSATR
jgi:putative ABC transport system permease protein